MWWNLEQSSIASEDYTYVLVANVGIKKDFSTNYGGKCVVNSWHSTLEGYWGKKIDASIQETMEYQIKSVASSILRCLSKFNYSHDYMFQYHNNCTWM